MISPSALTTLGNLKAQLGVQGTSDDARLEMIVESATDWIESRTGRGLVARNYAGDVDDFATEVPNEDYLYLSGSDAVKGDDGTYRLYLPQYPIVKPADGGIAVALDVLNSRVAGVDHANDVWTTLTEGDGYFVDYARGAVHLIGFPSRGFEDYRVTCTAGFYLGDNAPWVPRDLEWLCIELSKQLYRDSRNVQSESIGTWSRIYAQRSDPLIDDVFAKYTKLSI